MKITERRFIKGYVIGSSIAMLLLIGGVTFLSIMIIKVNNNAQAAVANAGSASTAAQQADNDAINADNDINKVNTLISTDNGTL